jgi:hypothetical protein
MQRNIGLQTIYSITCRHLQEFTQDELDALEDAILGGEMDEQRELL